MKELQILKEKANSFCLGCETHNFLPDQYPLPYLPISYNFSSSPAQNLLSHQYQYISQLWEPLLQSQWAFKIQSSSRRNIGHINLCLSSPKSFGIIGTQQTKYIFCVYLWSLSVDISRIRIWQISERQRHVEEKWQKLIGEMRAKTYISPNEV